MRVECFLKQLWTAVLVALLCGEQVAAQFRVQTKGKAELLASSVNSPLDEISPMLSQKTGALYFTRLRHPENVGGLSDKGDIWYAPASKDSWSFAQNADIPLNSPYLDLLIGFAEGETLLYLLHETPTRRVVARSRRSEDSWQKPEPVEIPYFWSKSNHQSGYISPDGKLLLLAIESFGSYGNEDIYISFRDENGNWSALKNLGSNINTTYEERSPFLLPDSRTLIFATNGRDGHGSWDIYQSRRLSEDWLQWSLPENLGTAINTPGAETFLFIPEGQQLAYFVSTQNSNSYNNVWRIPIDLLPTKEVLTEKLPEASPTQISPPTQPEQEASSTQISPSTQPNLSLYLVDKSTDAAPDTNEQLFIRDKQGGISANVPLQRDGGATLPLNLSGRRTLEFVLQGYLPLTKEVTLSSTRDTQLKLFLSPLKDGSELYGDVHFVQGSAQFLENSQENLQKIVHMLQANPNIHLFIAGHTDNRGSTSKNLKLSRARVRAVTEYLINHGIDSKRLSGRGYGGTRPIASNRNDKGRAQNRRVEFIIKKPK